MTYKPMTDKIRDKIKMYVKNKADISELIQDIDIKGENLSNTIIKTISRKKCDIRGTDFSGAIIGEVGKVTNLSSNDFRNCSFRATKFVGVIFLRHCDCRGCDFGCSYMQDVEYQHSDFRNCNFCEAVMRLGVDYGYKSKVDSGIFQDLTKHWDIEVKQEGITIKGEEGKNEN